MSATVRERQATWTEVLRFGVEGKPQPAGSKRAFVPRGRDGKPFMRNGQVAASVIDANPNAKDWKRAVAYEARQCFNGALLTGPLLLSITFARRRPKNHYRTGKNSHLLHDDAVAFPVSKPDLLKYARGVEDALTGIVWVDDAQIVQEHLWKEWCETTEREGALIVVSTLHEGAA